ncbi:NAD(P)H-hydrate dehydratase [Oryzobacter sp. R7]|uniref:ADP-dependent NAD(P)H-hydrate dehydratase n=1 Tax=Oryzobacter faecalis TaxID=3388656 RepID=UPI00398C8943
MDDRPDGADVLTAGLMRGWPLPDPGGDKNAKGRLLVIGGSESTPGAVLLAAESALRAGAGKVQVATTAATATHLGVALPEALVVGLPAVTGGIAASAAPRLLDLSADVDAVLVGPGLTDPEAACALLEGVVPHLDTALVVDALGTAFLSAHPGGLRHLARRALLTPNATELAELTGLPEDRVCRDVLHATRTAARMTGVTVLGGSDDSFVVEASGRAWWCRPSPPGAAVAGSGDVKAGIVAGLATRGAPPAQAAAWGAFLHTRVAEVLTASVGQVGFLAREMPPLVPRVLAEVRA